MQNRNKILTEIRKAEKKSDSFHTEDNNDYFKKHETGLLESFIEELKKVKGNSFICNNINDLKKEISSYLSKNKIDKLYCQNEKIISLLNNSVNIYSDSNDLYNLNAAVTSCDFLIARTGSVMISSKQSVERKNMVLPAFHFVIATESQLVYDLEEALEKIKSKYNKLPSLITTITGPSRTADIEKTLVMGAHGPKELNVFIVKDE